MITRYGIIDWGRIFPSLATMCDCAGADPPVLVEGFDRITKHLSSGDKSDIHIRCGVRWQGCDHFPIPVDSITFLTIGTVSPGKVHGHGAAADSKFASVIIDRPDRSVRQDRSRFWRSDHRCSIYWGDDRHIGLGGINLQRTNLILVGCM